MVSSDDAASIAAGVLLWLPFDDFADSVTPDASGANADASCFTNCPTLIGDGRHGSAMAFDSTGRALSARPVVPPADFTWTVWIRLAAGQPFSGVLSMHGESGLRPGGAEVCLYGTEITTFAHSDQHPSMVNVALGTWTHVALVRETGAMRTYVDGTLADTAVETDPQDFGGCELLIGVDADSGCTGLLNGYFEGDLDEVRIYDRPLTGSEIAADLASATPVPPP